MRDLQPLAVALVELAVVGFGTGLLVLVGMVAGRLGRRRWRAQRAPVREQLRANGVPEVPLPEETQQITTRWRWSG